jgi:hypothetical protein
MNNLFIDWQPQLSLQQTKLLIKRTGFERLNFLLTLIWMAVKKYIAVRLGVIYDSLGDQ